MLVCFELSMPGVGSWDGKWSGSGDYYARVRSFRVERQRALLERAKYHLLDVVLPLRLRERSFGSVQELLADIRAALGGEEK